MSYSFPIDHVIVLIIDILSSDLRSSLTFRVRSPYDTIRLNKLLTVTHETVSLPVAWCATRLPHATLVTLGIPSMPLTLGQAAKLTGLGKTTLTRAIKAGKLSAHRKDDGSYEIDGSELSRVYTLNLDPSETPVTSGETVEMARDATPTETPSDPEVTARLAALDMEVQGLKALLSEVRESRDAWRGQAERLALMKPAEVVTPPALVASPAPVVLPRLSTLWRRLAG